MGQCCVKAVGVGHVNKFTGFQLQSIQVKRVKHLIKVSEKYWIRQKFDRQYE